MMSTKLPTIEEISQLYRTPGHPIAFSAPFTVYNYFKGRIPLTDIQHALEHIDTYTLHREYKQPQLYNMYYAYERRHQFQADLIDISSLKDGNDGVTFLLVVIDLFSRKIWVMPLKSKSGADTSRALQAWIESLADDIHKQPRLLTDSGSEFYNRQVKVLLKDKSFTMYKAKNINKAAIVERVNKTLQILIYKFLDDRGDVRYLDKLPLLVKSYNLRKHRTHQYHYSPNEADLQENEDDVRSIHLFRAGKKAMKARRTKYRKFSIGDQVRIKTHGKTISTARRAYLQQFHGELFVIIGKNERMPVTTYLLRSMDTEEDIDGGFYANELVHVRGDLFKIEKILRKRGTGANRRVLVRWKYFSPRWDSWIYEKDIEDI